MMLFQNSFTISHLKNACKKVSSSSLQNCKEGYLLISCNIGISALAIFHISDGNETK